MKKRNLKDVFLGLLAGVRRRAGDKPPGDSMEASAARAEAKSETGGRLSQKPPGPPADWLAKRSGGPPAHWVERVRQVTPEMMRNEKRDEADATSQLQDPRRIQRKSAAPRAAAVGTAVALVALVARFATETNHAGRVSTR